MNLGNAIKDLRESQGLRQKALSASCKISATYLSQIENNAKLPNLSTLEKIAQQLGVPLPILFFLALDEKDIKPEKRKAFQHIAPAVKSMIAEFFNI